MGRITTLGRGGLGHLGGRDAAAIRAERCDIIRRGRRLYDRPARGAEGAPADKIAFEEMLEMASLGAKVMQVRSIELSMVHQVRHFVRSSFDAPEDIDPHAYPPVPHLHEAEIMEQQVVTASPSPKDEAKLSIRRVQDKPGVAASIFGPLPRPTSMST